MASCHAQADIRSRIAEAERVANTDSQRGLSLLDALARDVAQGPLAERQAVRESTCWLLGQSAPAQALELVRKAEGEATAMLRLCGGYALEQLDRREEALAEYEAGVLAGRRAGNDSVLARALALRGEQRYVRGLYAGAIEDLKAAHALQARLDEPGQRRYVLNALANLYADRNVGDYDAALASYRDLLVEHEKSGNRQNIATAHFNIASTYEKKGNLGAARPHFEQALAIDRARGAAADIATDQRAYAVLLSKLGEDAQALRLLDQALALAAGDETLVSAIRLSRGAAFRRARMPVQALAEFSAVRRFYEAPRNERFLQKLFEEESLARAAMGDWKGAYAAQGRMMAAQEVLNQQMLDERTTRLRVQFQSEQARARNTELQYQNSVQRLELDKGRDVRRWQLAALAASAGVILLLAAFAMHQRRLGSRMRDLALTDELTRLPNRRHLMALGLRVFSDAAPLSVAALDIDHFKRINDRFGHAIGDLVLQRVAHALQAALREGDVAGRTGGEEFVALLHGAGELDAMRAAERLRSAVERMDCSGLPAGLAPSISIGVAQRTPGESLDALLQRADQALYAAKEAGRNRVSMAA
ncbi:putative Diguanylate cyclase [Massilia sp. 9I]|nr:putative Diguanylate cyclase [Massilia sp. 9I]